MAGRKKQTPDKPADAPPAPAPAHSPGPWKLEFCDQYSALGGHRDVKAADGTVVASVVGTGPKCEFEPATAANCGLIAAAPELLAACKLAAGIIERLTAPGGAPKVLLDAIAKAEGAVPS